MAQARYYSLTQRISLKNTRNIIHAIHDGSLAKADYGTLPIFNLQYPKSIAGVDSHILNPVDSWPNKDEYTPSLKKVAEMFKDNFKRYESDASDAVKRGAPVL